MTENERWTTPKAETPEELGQLIHQLTQITEGGGVGYEQSADALWKAAAIAFNYVAARCGVTGFQASWAALTFYGHEMRIDGPFGVVKAQDALYPQYDVAGKSAKWLEEWSDWLKAEALKLLQENADRAPRPGAEEYTTVHPNVWAHWRRLAGIPEGAEVPTP